MIARRLVIVSLFTAVAFAQNFTVDVTDTVLPPDGFIPVNVVYTGQDALTSFKASSSLFLNDQGSVPLPVAVLKQCGDTVQTGTIDLVDGLGSLCLKIPNSAGDGKYSGNLILVGKKPDTPKKITFSKPAAAAATLVTDRQAETLTLSRPWYSFLGIGFDPVIGSAVLQEKSGKGAVRGFTIQVDGTLKAPGTFDPASNLAFTAQGEPLEKPSSTGATTERLKTILPGASAGVTVQGIGLQPGEYIIPLRFSAPNTASDNAKITLTVDVRDSVWLAIAVLGFGLLISFVITKIITAQRRRIALTQQIHDLRLSKGGTLPPLPAVVWVDAVLSLCTRLSKRFWLAGADLIDARIASIRNTVDILQQVRELCASLERHLSPLLYGRASEAIFRVLSELGAQAPDDTAVARVKKELAPFEDWLDAIKFPAAFWTTIQPSLLGLQREIAAGIVPDPCKPAVAPLKTALDTALAAAPQTSDAASEIYQIYARLRLLWDARLDTELFTKMSANPAPDLTECFRLADQKAWNLLKAGHGGLTIKMPSTSDPDGLEAFTPLVFSVDAPASVSGSFLFRHKVKCAWEFTQAPTLQWHEKMRFKTKPKQKEVSLSPTTMGPTVVQYLPRRGRVHVSVTLSYNGEKPISVGSTRGPDIHDSTDFGILDAFGKIEYVSWAIAAAVAIATGLATYYFKNQTFGSYQDYLTLALWGAGMDQGKNFLQALQSVSAQPANSPAAAH
ncbi:MAG TPA: hypothetical protein VGN17_11585 [Bryobacteraceae bacterium]|jgi:hypothetical protein